MQIRRCAVLFFERREELSFDFGSLLAGGAGLDRNQRWLAIAPHLDHPIDVQAADLQVLGDLSPSEWTSAEALPMSSGIERLIQCGLIISDQEEHAAHREQDEKLRRQYWWPASAVFHRQERWQGVDGAKAMEANAMATAKGLRKRLGAPPVHVCERVEQRRRVPLPRSDGSDFDALLVRRATCRNFGPQPLNHDLFARMVQRVFSAQAKVQVSDDTVFLKKTSPSGGGLHPTEAYLIVQNVTGVEPGLYHYHPVDHALEPLPPPALPLDEFARLALAGQHWFANAPVLVVLTPRFARSFWKYRHHAKAYRALVLDSGHLSQTLYLSATELGLGAFVTSAINEVDIEQAFGLDPLQESPLAICGFGWRAERMETTEFDPAGEVWEQVADS